MVYVIIFVDGSFELFSWVRSPKGLLSAPVDCCEKGYAPVGVAKMTHWSIVEPPRFSFDANSTVPCRFCFPQFMVVGSISFLALLGQA